jgi:RNA polymerase sigma-70 factor, ECF subfamily
MASHIIFLRERLAMRVPVWPRAASGRSAQDLVLLAIGDLIQSPIETSSSPEEVALVRSMKQPGSGAVDEIYRRHSQKLYRFIYWRVGESAEEAEELTLESFLSAIKLCDTYEGNVGVFAWLCGIAKLRIIDFHRRRKRGKRGRGSKDLSLDQLDPERQTCSRSLDQVIERISASQVVDTALATLAEHEREALLLQHIEGLTLREIAVTLGRSEDAVDALLRRAKAKFKDSLLKLMGEGDQR